MTAGEVCNRQVVVTRPDTSVVDAVHLMKTHLARRQEVIELRIEAKGDLDHPVPLLPLPWTSPMT